MYSDGDDDDQAQQPEPNRPWFGPKRFGVGLRPQTWQGFAIVACIVVIAAVVAATSSHKHGPLLVPVIAAAVAIGVRALTAFQRRR
jgi:hypothetical protein